MTDMMTDVPPVAGDGMMMLSTVPCCPPLGPDATCDILDFHYRLTHDTVVGTSGNRRQTVPVEVKIHLRLTRCPGPLAVGDLVYTNTLLPGEKVKLFTSDRRTRFTYDSSTSLSYRSAQASEESFYMQSMSDFMMDVTGRDEAKSSNKSHAHVDGHGEAGVDILGLGGSADMSGNFDANSTSDFLRETSQHAESAHHSSEMGTRKAASVSVGEVQTRTHTETQSEDHFESASREFANPNQCHAVTFLFYQIDKTQTVTVTLESIERRAIDPAGDITRVTNNPLVSSGGVGLIRNDVLATDKERISLEANARQSAALEQNARQTTLGRASLFTAEQAAPLPATVKQQAVRQVDEDLVKAGLLSDVGGDVSDEARTRFSFTKKSALPTPGILVKGCLDDCDICEPSLMRKIELDLERQELQNKLLARQIELLDKAQEYRCCAAGTDA